MTEWKWIAVWTWLLSLATILLNAMLDVSDKETDKPIHRLPPMQRQLTK
jgi:hypothetical protein